MSEAQQAQQAPPRRDQPQNIATAITEVSERATMLVHEEIELAKAEVTEKVAKLARGAIVAGAAGIFFLVALIFVLNGLAWLLYYELPIGNRFTYFWGFFAMAIVLVVLGVLAGLLAFRLVKKSAPPVPSMAIEEARKIRETVSSSGETVSSSGETMSSSGEYVSSSGETGALKGGADGAALPS